MTSAVNAVGSGLASLGRTAMSGLSHVGDFIGNAAGGLGRGLAGIFNSGAQPGAGTPAAMQSGLSQGAPDIPDVAGGNGALNASGLAGGFDMGKAGDALSQSLARIGGADVTDAATPMASIPSLTGGAQPSPSLAPAATPSPAPGGMGGNVIQFLRQNALPAALLANTLIRGNQTPPEVERMNALAGAAEARAAAAQTGAQAALEGNLPGGAQASIDQALAAAEATIRSRYAALGMSGSTPEMQELARAQLSATTAAFEQGQRMAQMGFQAAAGDNTLAANLYRTILEAETQRGTALGDALAAFSAGLVDQGRTINPNPQQAA